MKSPQQVQQWQQKRAARRAGKQRQKQKARQKEPRTKLQVFGHRLYAKGICFFRGVAIGVVAVWFFGTYHRVKEKWFSPDVTVSQSAEIRSGIPWESDEKEAVRLDRFLEKMTLLERAAEDWHFQHSSEEGLFLLDDILPLRVPGLLGCTIDPSAQMPVCRADDFSLIAFLCTPSGCHWMAGRRQEDSSLSYYISANWEGAGRWEYAANVSPVARKLGKDLYKRKGWRITAW